MKYTTKEYYDKKEVLEEEDSWMDAKIEYMYNYLDFDHDRARVRTRFLKEMNKRTTLKDIGETLDKLIYDSKAATWSQYDVTKDWNKKPERSERDYSS